MSRTGTSSERYRPWPAVAACLFAWSPAALACEHPSLVQVPPAGGLSWNRYETLLPEVRLYLESMEAYVGCLRDEIGAAEAAPANAQTVVALLVARNNAAAAEMETVLELYRALNEDLEEMQRAAAEPAAP